MIERVGFALGLAFLIGAAPGAAVAAPPASMTLLVDESQAPRGLATVRETIPCVPGTLTLAYPKWIPGEHGPTGPIADLAVLHVSTGGATLPWRRDPDDPYLVMLEVPPGATSIDVAFNTLFQSTISESTLRVDWNAVVLYPLGSDKRELAVTPSLILPAGWTSASDLHATGGSGARIDYAPISLERLVDSPVLAGAFVRVVPLASVWPAELDITADTQAALDRSDAAHAFALFATLVDQDRAMFGFRHFTTLHILVSQSSGDPFDGLEHEESPYNAVDADDLSKKDALEKWGGWLLAHEQSHSWDGKYRRPAELYSKTDFQGPERTSLLWVYEGLNEYIGYVLATRSGFNDQAFMRDHLARSIAGFAARTARTTTPLVDTATESWILRDPEHGGWSDYRRSQDYYEEGMLDWLEADAIIRNASHGKRSLDDFLRAFFGQRDTGPIVVPYTRADVETALAAVQPYDWHGFFERRIYQPDPAPPTGGVEAAGWRLVYNDTVPAKYFGFPKDGGYDATFSLGFAVGKRNAVDDVMPGSPADLAGFAPQMTILAVDGRAYTTDVLDDAIAHPPGGTIAFIVQTFDQVKTIDVRYAGGVRYPHLERIPNAPDDLSEIFRTKKN
jgi:predicted metalloprotease with PDZ domain